MLDVGFAGATTSSTPALGHTARISLILGLFACSSCLFELDFAGCTKITDPVFAATVLT